MRYRRWIGILLIVLSLVAVCSAIDAQALAPALKMTIATTPTATPHPCPSPCECMWEINAINRWGTDGYTRCSETPCWYQPRPGGVVVPWYCFKQKTTTTAVPACQAPCECMAKSAADAKWGPNRYTQCSKTACGPSSTIAAVVPSYCYKPLETTKPACRDGCTCLPRDDGAAGKLSLCDGKMTVCGSSVTGLPLYCYENPVAVTRVTAAATTSPYQMVTGVAVAPVTLQAVNPAHVVQFCQISGELKNFRAAAGHPEVKFQEADVMPKSCSPSPPYTCIGPLVMAKADSEPFSVPVSVEGTALMYKAMVSCDRAYRISVAEPLLTGECAYKGTWKPLVANIVVMNGSSRSGYDFEYVSDNRVEDAACALCRAPSLPASFDWRNVDGRNWITPVRAQHLCGSCWAMATLGVTEAMYNIEHDSFMNLDLSEQNFISCPGGGGTCSGGWPFDAAKYAKDTGVVTEACFPYTGHDDPCTYACAVPAANRYRISKYTALSLEGSLPRDTSAWKRALLCKGPLSVCDHHHCVTIVGWDDAAQSWIFKNSWGEGWGTSGYGKRLYTDDTWMLYAWWFGGVSPNALYAQGVMQYATNRT